ncbi:FAD-dependent monooxygenase [Actinomadura sp. WAC 06369]|uniref:FAD-dependent monooxygenase n=1 Tax=Actinomadura sp. WAC 06369 TaxID=2203193 RepID=UPI000F789184|nr:FAD-dependent monooxygenase [Actinomadura sp. WAC 06369]RSN53381.1 monooxygenase [Actinomadura sp. WAC 06369]
MEQVVIVGGGPVGLWLAAELRLGGADVTVLEARAERDARSKALTVHPRTLELLASRGIADRFLADGRRIPGGHFGALDERLPFGGLDTPFPFTLALPQARTEELLEEHAVAMGARVLRRHRAVRLTQDGERVRIEAAGPAGPYVLDARYAVGCDGTRSTVRDAAGIGFPGTPATAWGWLADVVLDDPPPGGALSVSGPAGGVMVVPLTETLHRVVGTDPAWLGADWPGDPTLDGLRAKVARIAGGDLGMRDPHWLSTFGNAARQADRYRAGRVLLAGDAAHMHFPAGGVGLNVGLQDAANLGWRLAATVRGDAPDGRLLDGYHAERHPVGADLLLATRAQTALMTAFDSDGQALRALLGGLVAAVPDLADALALRLTGLGVAYPAPPGAHPLTGRRAPDLALAGTTLFTLLHAGRHVLLDLAGDAPPPAGAHRLTVHSGPAAGPGAEWAGVRAALVRPDGHVAWAADTADPDGLAAAVAGRFAGPGEARPSGGRVSAGSSGRPGAGSRGGGG